MKNALKLLLIINIIFILVGCNDNSKKEVNNNIVLQIPKVNENEIGKYYKFSDYLDAKTDPIAATKIGYAYSEELKDYDKAIKWFKYSNSMKPTGTNSNYMCYAYQMKKDYKTAIKWCKNAIDLGNKEALFQLAYTYREKKDYKKAEEWFVKSFESKDKDAPIALGYLYTNYLHDYKKAEKYYKEGVKLKDLEANHNLSRLYHHHLKDDIKASAYAIALIENKYSKSSVLKLLKNTWNIPNETIKKGYELQLNSDEFPIKFKGKLDLDE
ncbi:tetratricopeptide repeat protein [Malaciobacter halophilus]|nr:tetratricopeptide repeat protein [Malaciobacter halophilus]